MSMFFRFFPHTQYKFGDETMGTTFENISIYSDVVDQISNSVTAYSDYNVQPGERPDQVSQKLYGTPHYHWTFFLMNPTVRYCGWPLDPQKLYEKAIEDYDAKVITTKTVLTDKFLVGQTMTGLSSGATAKVAKRNLDLGQIFIDTSTLTGTFTASESITSPDSEGVIETIVATSFEDQYNAAHHYEDADGNTVDIDPAVGPGSLLTEVTWFDRLEKLNEGNRTIRVIKPSIVGDVVRSFREAVGSV